MSKDKAQPQDTALTAETTDRLHAQHGALWDRELPSLGQALAEVGMEEAPMKPLPAREETAYPGPPSIHLLTGLLTGEATPEEQALWEATYADDPKAQARLAQLQGWTSSSDLPKSESQYIHQEQMAMLQRGRQLLQGLPPLPQLQQQPTPGVAHELIDWDNPAPEQQTPTAIASFAAQTAPSQSDARHSATPIDIDLPTKKTAPVDQPSPSSPGWQSWLGWSMPMVMAMGWLLLWQPPVDRSIPSLGMVPQDATQAPKSLPIYRPAPARAHPKGLGQTAPAARPTFSLLLLRKRGPKIKAMPAAFIVKDGDMARFVVRNTSRSRHYVTLFLVEQDGALSHLYPSRADGKQLLPASKTGTYLQGGIALSAPKRPERIYGCITQAPLGPQDLKAFTSKVKAGQQLKALATLPLPCVYQTSWLLLPGHSQHP